MNESVLVEREGAAVRISINRPERRNAMNEDVCRGILRGIDEAESQDGVRVIVLTGSGDKAFCAGGDLKPNADGTPFTIDPADPKHYVVSLFRRMESCGLPILARVNGHALAGGMGLVCACDLAIATRAAKFGVPESGLGIFPMMIMPYMMRIIPRRKLFEISMTGELFDADEALELGIVNYVTEPDTLDEKVAWLIGRLADKSPSAIRLGKQAFRTIEDMPLDKAFDYTQLMLPIMSMTEDAREGMAAFNEKRAPRWTGR